MSTASAKANPKLGPNVPSSAIVPSDRLVSRYNRLNRAIVAGLPEIARAYDSLHRHLPLLRQMQALLSQRPKQPATKEFTMLHRVFGKTLRMATPATRRDDLPTWSQWISAYAAAIDYSVRHIRRLMLDEPRAKVVKECGWSAGDHNRLIRAATAGFDLVNAIEAGADTACLVQEIREIMATVPQDILDKPYQPQPRRLRRRRARPATSEDVD